MSKIKIISVVGARPNFMKVAPLNAAFSKNDLIESVIVHTGQHYDAKMSDIFFNQLGLPKPHYYLGIGGGSHAEQTGKVMMAFEKVVLDESPDFVLVVGDVNSTIACALVATKLHIPVVHVEAGLRSGDMLMPEEVNRVLTDRISSHLFVTEQSGLDNLKAEGFDDKKVHFVGNVMIDSVANYLPKAKELALTDKFGVEKGNYVLSTMHRPSNVDTAESLKRVIEIYSFLTSQSKVVLPLHPRTESNLKKHNLYEQFVALDNLIITEPLGYLEFLGLMAGAKLVVTDSGGIQEETTYLGVPCITFRSSTERPVTVDLGTNVLVASLDPNRVKQLVLDESFTTKGEVPPLWDGKTAERITEILLNA